MPKITLVSLKKISSCFSEATLSEKTLFSHGNLTHTIWLVNYNHLRIVNKIIIFGRNCLNFLSVIDKYLGLQYCMQFMLFFNCMFFTRALT